jgi:hypothetical protein
MANNNDITPEDIGPYDLDIHRKCVKAGLPEKEVGRGIETAAIAVMATVGAVVGGPLLGRAVAGSAAKATENFFDPIVAYNERTAINKCFEDYPGAPLSDVLIDKLSRQP